MNNLKKNYKLRVEEALIEDIRRYGENSIMRIDPNAIKEMNLKWGVIIEISYKRTNKIRVSLRYDLSQEDRNINIIRLGPSMIKSCGFPRIGDFVEIRKSEIKAEEAKKITLSKLEGPFEALIMPQQLIEAFYNRVVTKGDILSFYIYNNEVDFVVEDYSPKANNIIINRSSTKIILSEKKHENFNLQEERSKNEKIIKKTIIELGTKFERLYILEILEECSIQDEELIINTVKKMIDKKEIHAQYFSSTKSVLFDLQANIEELDKLIAKFKEWEEEKVEKK